eukprot:GHUV01036042.1.p1 GENE.GHUV01036042.1~~GHUV01036042.1.p1  ORF type:complete len:424 (+),score=145.26 GHUV01036042.1:140-1411(+)
MLPNLGGEGSKSQKGAGFIGRIFGRQGSSKDEGGDSPRNTTNRAGTGSLNAPTAAKQYVEPRQAGAAVTTGMAKPAAQSKQDMFSAKSRKVLFQGREETEVSSEGRASVLDHHNVFKRSHTVNDIGTSLSSSPKPAASPKSPVSTATALANLGGKTDSGNSSMTSLVNSRVSIAAAMNVPTEELEGKSHDELKKMFLALQRQTKELKHEVEEKKKSLSGSGGTARTSVIVDFSEPKHQQRPSLIEKNVEQLRNAAGSASARSSRVSYAPHTVGGLDEEDSGFLEDEADSKPKSKPAAMDAYLAAKEQEEARRKQKEKEREAAQAAAAEKQRQAAEAMKERSKSLNSSAAAAGAPKRKYKLLSVYPLLPPNMRREEWSLTDFKIDKKLHAGYASEVWRVSASCSMLSLLAMSELGGLRIADHGG